MLSALPIDEHIPEILQRLNESRAVVLVAQPGAGKTTRVPPALLESPLLSSEHPNIVMLQPRRVAARAASLRIAQENHWRIGEQVGWHVRFDKQITSRTRLRVLTEGILSRQLIDDPFLDGIGAVILDEFHERSIHTDLCLALLKEIRQAVRPDLLLIVMSATLDAQPVARFLDDCPVINVPGRTFPIEIEHAAAPSGDGVSRRVERALQYVLPNHERDILVFLPGAREINDTARDIAATARQCDAKIVPLHGSLPPAEQIRALEPAEQRKIILATNIAETSLTIEGVNIVIDAGLARVAGYDPQRGLDRLDLKRISKASAIQRAGRAGRTGPGRCIRLYTEKEFHALADFELPEIRRVDLCATVLALHGWGKSDVRNFGWYDPPSEPSLLAAENLLDMLGALENGRITELGRAMLRLPVHPRLARLLLAGADENLLEPAAAITALLSERDILPMERAPKTQAESDLLMRLDLIDSFPNVARIRDELLRIGQSIAKRGNTSKSPRPSRGLSSDQTNLLQKLILRAYPDRVCRRRVTDPSSGVMVGGSGVRLAPDSVVRQHEFFVAVDARHDDRNTKAEAIVRIASGIESQWLEEFFPRQIHQQRSLVFDEQRQRVVGLGTLSYRDLILREDRDAPVDPNQSGPILADAIKPRAAQIIQANEESANFLARLELLRKQMPEHPWPQIDPVEILTEMCRGKRSVGEIENLSSLPFLESRLTYPLDRLLDQHAPRTIAVPTGNQIRIQYSIDQPPILAVRLQELFGWTQTPRIAAGRVPIVLHLLGPNYRPVQITNDLASFWKTTYFQVRKDLRAQYPKHSWPEDPLTAKPQAKGSRRR